MVGCKIGNALLSFLFQDLADEEEDLACFCGGLGKFSEMLINVKGLLCEAEEFHNQDHDDDSLLGADAPSLEYIWTSDHSMTMCSLKEKFSCTGEIESAYDDCSHIEDIASIRTCITDILGASDCLKCVCGVLPFLCGTKETHDQDHDDDSLLGAAAPSLESSSDSGVLDLYEGNDATQNQVCTLRWGHQV